MAPHTQAQLWENHERLAFRQLTMHRRQLPDVRHPRPHTADVRGVCAVVWQAAEQRLAAVKSGAVQMNGVNLGGWLVIEVGFGLSRT